MDNQSREIIIKHVLKLIEIMRATTDTRTKDMIDREIKEFAKDFNINL